MTLLDSELVTAFGSTVSKCIDDGHEDGKKEKWDLDREHECIRIADEDNPYRDALEEGCHAGGFPRENCD